ncbi:MAG: ATP-binding protein [Deltaproteobacteria bacterium]|nr:ATP-binding protein [Deltaproteobacteria bacterium]
MGVDRNIFHSIDTDLQKKFVFLSGPRQVGKTTLAKRLIRERKGTYLLYDDNDDRRVILEKNYVTQQWVCLDEFHKYPRWKNHIKSIFDKYHETLHLLLTGSARLDIFQKSGDSLFGRYYLHHLHPLSLGELHTNTIPKFSADLCNAHEPLSHMAELMRFGGFPEPFFAQSQEEHLRWSNMRRQLLVREDLRELTHIELLVLLEQLMLLLPRRIGSLFSYRSLAEDIQVSPPTIQHWMQVFEHLFIVFKIQPYSKNITRSIRKQPKYFLTDWSQIDDEGARFENFIASHLWKAVQVWTDLGKANAGLYFIRDRDQREVDFLLTRDQKPMLLIETKIADAQPSSTLQYFCRRLQIPAMQLLQKPGIVTKRDGIFVASADQWLAQLP